MEVDRFLPLPTASLHILLALAEGDKHGYALMGDIERLSDGRVRVGPATLYGTIKRLLADGLIQETAQRPDPALDDQRRRYYQLTTLGRQACTAEVQRLRALLDRANLKRLSPGLDAG